MGIQGLLPMLRSVTQDAHIREYAHMTVGIDAYVWMHKCVYACIPDIARALEKWQQPGAATSGRKSNAATHSLKSFFAATSAPARPASPDLPDALAPTFVSTTAHLRWCEDRLDLLLAHGVRPYFVFDGGPLPAKRGQEERRAADRARALGDALAALGRGDIAAAHSIILRAVDIAPQLALGFINILRKREIPFVVAPYEADAQLAYLAQQKIVEAIITEDSDLLPYGAARVLFKMEKDGRGKEIQREALPHCEELAFKHFSDDMFLDMCILSGCDYLPSLPGMGIKSAHAFVARHKRTERLLQMLAFEHRQSVVTADYTEGFKRARMTFLHQRVFDPRSRKLVTVTPFPAAIAHVTHASLDFLGPWMSDEQACGIADALIDPTTDAPYLDAVPGLYLPPLHAANDEGENSPPGQAAAPRGQTLPKATAQRSGVVAVCLPHATAFTGSSHATGAKHAAFSAMSREVDAAISFAAQPLAGARHTMRSENKGDVPHDDLPTTDTQPADTVRSRFFRPAGSTTEGAPATLPAAPGSHDAEARRSAVVDRHLILAPRPPALVAAIAAANDNADYGSPAKLNLLSNLVYTPFNRSAPGRHRSMLPAADTTANGGDAETPAVDAAPLASPEVGQLDQSRVSLAPADDRTSAEGDGPQRQSDLQEMPAAQTHFTSVPACARSMPASTMLVSDDDSSISSGDESGRTPTRGGGSLPTKFSQYAFTGQCGGATRTSRARTHSGRGGGGGVLRFLDARPSPDDHPVQSRDTWTRTESGADVLRIAPREPLREAYNGNVLHAGYVVSPVPEDSNVLACAAAASAADLAGTQAALPARSMAAAQSRNLRPLRARPALQGTPRSRSPTQVLPTESEHVPPHPIAAGAKRGREDASPVGIDSLWSHAYSVPKHPRMSHHGSVGAGGAASVHGTPDASLPIGSAPVQEIHRGYNASDLSRSFRAKTVPPPCPI